MTTVTLKSQAACFGGTMGFYTHESTTCRSPMQLAVYIPPQAKTRSVPVLYYLSGLTCTPENFVTKAGAQQFAARHGLLLVVPDTSPRQTKTPGEDQDWDLGTGAGFYVDATVEPWVHHYQMYSYVTQELPALIGQNFPADLDRQGIFGHSMGGHGALICALKNPQQYQSVSAFSPISAPTHSAWGQKIFQNYLGDDQQAWSHYDASQLVLGQQLPFTILIDQGAADEFLDQLQPERLVAACQQAGQALNLRMQEGYDHSYYFVSSFMSDHMEYHAKVLLGANP